VLVTVTVTTIATVPKWHQHQWRLMLMWQHPVEGAVTAFLHLQQPQLLLPSVSAAAEVRVAAESAAVQGAARHAERCMRHARVSHEAILVAAVSMAAAAEVRAG